MADTRKDCCRKPENLGPVVQERADLSYRQCAVCGCRHFELRAEPGIIGLKGMQAG